MTSEERPAKISKVQPSTGVIVQLVSEEGDKAGACPEIL
jgi:hypothetical protein